MKKNTHFTAACVTPVLDIKSIISSSPENPEKIFWFWGAWGQDNQYIISILIRRFLCLCKILTSVTMSKENSVLHRLFNIYFNLEIDFLIRAITMFHNRSSFSNSKFWSWLKYGLACKRKMQSVFRITKVLTQLRPWYLPILPREKFAPKEYRNSKANVFIYQIHWMHWKSCLNLKVTYIMLYLFWSRKLSIIVRKITIIFIITILSKGLY